MATDLPALPDDFDRSAIGDGMPRLFMTGLHRFRLRLLEQTYERHHPLTTPGSKEARIPKIIHQIWIGGELPEPYRTFRQGWIDRHPGWDVRLWTEDAVDDLDFEERDLYESAWNPSMKTNVLRAVLVREFGGLYIDTDYECLRAFDPFHHRYDFYAGVRGGLGVHVRLPWIYPHPFGICSSLFGARPGHPLLNRFLRKVRRLWHHSENMPRLPGERWVTLFDRKGLTRVTNRNARIGYLPFQTTAYRVLADPPDEPMVILPPSYFQPMDTFWNYKCLVSPYLWARLWRHVSRGGRGLPEYLRGPEEHTFAIHHSRGAWG